MKKLILLALMLVATATTLAQEKGKFRFGFDVGYVFAGEGGGGGLFSMEPKYNISDHANIGFEFGVSASVSDDQADATMHYLLTYDYYFKKDHLSFAPFIGLGLGGYHLPEINFFSAMESSDEFGGFIRGGIEAGKFRFTAEYNMIPKSKFPSGNELKNSYFALGIGFFIGGGKWN